MAKSPGSSRKKTIIIVILVFLFGIIFAGFFNVGLALTNEMEFCTSCHSQQQVYEEYKESMHYKNPAGVRATCSDCHVPKPFLQKMIMKVMASKDVYHEILGTIDTEEKFEALRWDMASRVWAKMEKTDSRECRSCHDYEKMDLAEQDRTARSRHGNAEDKGQTCIDCHKGVAHEEPDEPDDYEDPADTEAEAEEEAPDTSSS